MKNLKRLIVVFIAILSIITMNSASIANAETNENVVDNLFTYHAPFNKAEKIINGVKISSVGQGLRTNDFISSSPNVAIKIKGSFTTSNASIKLGINKNSGGVIYVEKANLTGGTIDYTFTIDASNLNVYSDAKSFFVLVNTADTKGQILYDSIEIYPCENSRDNGNYITSFKPNESLIAINHMPTNVLFIGNSLLLGMDTDGTHGGAFGMGATSPYKDYAYYVEQAILNKNSSAQFSKLHDGAFEMAENDATAQSYIANNGTTWMNKDLIIIQIGDNVNSDIRRTTFNNNFGKLISDIRTKSPNARVLCVTGWYYNDTVANTILEACKSYNCEFLNISSLYTPTNKATNYVGATVTYHDRTTTNIQQTWSTHPGDIGYKTIADTIISML
ncbi:hypothetical protein C1H57_12430 [Clostridium sp. 2-1]|uniref:hypothetical protein n=1 Tax=Clostridium TaxID=1485 RepID=UPI000CDB02D4|nr:MULTISPECIES: hypothetical protein [Clostridium]MBN7576027.1 hypothetical protein [Clostridium beijerinckii]MBN7581140.1 hypothetical protein [Clostridium beijerinckii]MBN7585748.1 hypothetical protein [Clostridium beijerinckii]MBO0521537.1 hypothetical protein [Clostridium beijerinckii]POO90990.1 hypothetical protein C1H57_12430 [Clostridium sp. 2-1]